MQSLTILEKFREKPKWTFSELSSSCRKKCETYFDPFLGEMETDNSNEDVFFLNNLLFTFFLEKLH